MKKTLLIIALAAASIAARAGLQVGSELNGGTNNVAAATTNSYTGSTFDVTKTQFAATDVTFKAVGANSGTVTVSFDTSVDNANWKAGAFTLTATANGTNSVSSNASQSLGGVPFIRVGSVGNSGASAITNVTVKVYTKNGI